MAKIRFDGLDQLGRDLEKMARNAEKLSGRREVPFGELFTASFMRKYTRYSSIDALLEAGGFQAHTSEAFDAIPQSALDTHIAKVTRFRSWEQMVDTAVEEYIARQLGF